MKQKIGNMQSPDQPITDIDVVFTAMYNLIYEKLEQEPDKGIVVCKGQPNQRKVKWKKVLAMAHCMEDYFQLRLEQNSCNCCGDCIYWSSISKASPHLGKCKLKNKSHIHQMSLCKRFERKESQ